ncbi:ATP-binding protein [Palleniella muris]|uniref:ATP-binding protein n=1 Tax=Palleniella muris TaxID=3038145 RepID=A0AC61QPF4_9BACT|nr:ATP-binding protein [Palleniella muris]TGX81605.1 ATP-binding protein [Palleniella muris]
MKKEELKKRIAQGESSTLQFKLQWSDNDKISKETIAFANSRGGSIVFGIEDKTGSIEGLTYDEVHQKPAIWLRITLSHLFTFCHIRKKSKVRHIGYQHSFRQQQTL